jgi:lactoylglutathione lyase
MTPGSLITGIAHIGIRVHNLDRARSFYEGLGFAFIRGPVGPEPVAIMQHPSGVVINLILNAAHPSAPNVLMDVAEKHAGYTHIALSVTDVFAVKAALEQAGIAITEGPVRFASGGTSIFIRDPDRNVIEFNHDPS